MKLTIKRDQADQKGIFGGHKGVNFSLYARAELSLDERSLIDRYKVGEHVLASRRVGIRADGSSIEYKITVNGLANGKSDVTNSITALLELEESIKEGCRNLKTLLDVMSTFGGQEVLEI